MNPDFSEFSYGYAVTEELVTAKTASVVAAPTFPSLYQEGKKGGGYDVKVPLKGKLIFLQFKLSDCLTRNNAREHQAGLLRVPYYRMHLRPTKHSDQHNLLLDLEAQGESVFYIAPEFHLPLELNDYYLKKTVIANSAAFAPSDIGKLPDDDEHYVVFERDQSIGYRCSSEPIEIRKTSLTEGFSTLLKSRDVQTRQLGADGLRSIAERMIEVISRGEERWPGRERTRDIDGLRRVISNRTPVQALGYITRTFFDAELVILPG